MSPMIKMKNYDSNLLTSFILFTPGFIRCQDIILSSTLSLSAGIVCSSFSIFIGLIRCLISLSIFIGSLLVITISIISSSELCPLSIESQILNALKLIGISHKKLGICALKNNPKISLFSNLKKIHEIN